MELGITLSKEKTIERLIDTSIELFFASKDPISIHVLSSSANVMLTDLSKHRGIAMFVEQFIIPNKIAEWHRIERESYNFMKHANNDPSRELLFSERKNIVILFFCITKFKNLYERDTENMRIFFSYFLSKYPDIFTHPAIQYLKKEFKLPSVTDGMDNELKSMMWDKKSQFSLVPVPINFGIKEV